MYRFHNTYTPIINGSDSTLPYSSPLSSPSPTDKSNIYPTDFFLDSHHRAGGPYLCDLPAVIITVPCTNKESRRESDICRAVQHLVQNAGIEVLEISIYLRSSCLFPESTPVNTVLILAKRRSGEEKWCDAARLVREYVDTTEIAGVAVEILEDACMLRARCFSIEKEDEIFGKWEVVYTEILDSIRHDDWVGLTCLRYGYNNRRMDNPPTILVSVDRETDPFRNWDEEMKQIQDILRKHCIMDTAVKFVRDGVFNTGYDEPKMLDVCDLDDAVQAGASLGRRNDRHASGTFGGIVELLMPGEQEYRAFGLTCFHCIYSLEDAKERSCFNTSDETRISKWLDNPVQPGDTAARLLQVDQPSISDIEYTIQQAKPGVKFSKVRQALEKGESTISGLDRYNAWMSSFRGNEYTQKRFVDIEANDKHHLGHVFAGSGYSRCQTAPSARRPSMLDWALIDIKPHRMGKNIRKDSVIYDMGSTFDPDDSKTGAFLRHIGKVGRPSELTEGEISELKGICIRRIKQADGTWRLRETVESIILNPGHVSCVSFGRQGDTGAFLFKRTGVVFGLLVAGQLGSGNCYYTPIEDVFEDINKVTRAVEVRVKKEEGYLYDDQI